MSAYEISDQPLKGTFRAANLFGKTVEIGDEDEFLESHLKGGKLLLRPKSRWPAISRSTFEDCDVVLTKWRRSGRVNLCAAKFIRCKFHGTLQGLLLGYDERRDDLDSFGVVQDCDFTEAVVDDCLFLNTNPCAVTMPGLPHVVLEHPSSRQADVADREWPGELGTYMRICTDVPESVTVRVFHLPRVCKLAKCSIEEAVHALRLFGGVLRASDEG